MTYPSSIAIEIAGKRIKKLAHRTPVLTCQSIDGLLQTQLFFKCENLQKVGAFKYRGASNALSIMNRRQLKHGVATHSSGNHAQALALAAKIHETKAYIVMPSNAPKIKKQAVLGYGADIIECEPTLEARESTLEKVIEKTGAHFVHPYNDYRIIEGQATAAKELIEETRRLDYIVAPVGGGGLLSGTALSAHYFTDGTRAIGAEPKGADDAYRSLQAGKIIPSVAPKTIADGLLTSLGTNTFPIIQQFVERILTVQDDDIIRAMRLIWERMKVIVEPSAAVPLAAVMTNTDLFLNKKVGIILSGGNVDLDKLPF